MGEVYKSGLNEPAGSSGAVDSVFGRTGAVVAQSGDYRIDQITNSEYVQSTGVVYGGALSVNGVDNTKFDIAQGAVLIVNNSDLQNVQTDFITLLGNETGLTLGKLATEPRTNVGISVSNAVLPGIIYTNSFTALVGGVSQTVYVAEKSESDFNAEERRLIAPLGRFSHSNNTTISFEINLQQSVASPLGSLIDFISLFPSINVEGNNFSGDVGTLGVSKTEGKGFRLGSNYVTDSNNPNIQDMAAASPTTHFYRYQDGSGGFTQTGPTSVLNPNNWDDGSGTLQTVAPNRFTLQPVWVFAGSGTMFVQYGQDEFASKEAAIEALASINPILDPNLTDDAVFRGWFVIQEGASDLSDINQFEWRPPLSERGGGQGSTVVQDMQTVYNASINPEITTDASRGALTVQGGTGTDTDLNYEGKNNAGVVTFSVDANGVITGDGSGITNLPSSGFTGRMQTINYGSCETTNQPSLSIAYYNAFVAMNSKTVGLLRFRITNFSSAGDLSVGLYDDAGNNLGGVQTISVTGNGFVSATITPQLIIDGGLYKIGVSGKSGAFFLLGESTNTGDSVSTTETLSLPYDLPNTIGTESAGSVTFWAEIS